VRKASRVEGEASPPEHGPQVPVQQPGRRDRECAQAATGFEGRSR
jgi:hypothetical protein